MCALNLAAYDLLIIPVCASTHIIRTPSRVELLHARSSIVIAARAFGLAAIDMVSISFSAVTKELGLMSVRQ